MSYATQIIYNGKDAFFPQPTPLVEIDVRSIYYNELWTKTEDFILKGTITGCDFATITANQQQIIQNFAQNYQTLTIQETDNSVTNNVYNKNYAEIENISFAQSTWRGVLPYTIKINSYPSGFFSGAYGIINPVDKWDYNEQRDLSLDVSHTISAQGLSLSSGQTMSINNVVSWVQGRTGLNNAPGSVFIRNIFPATFYPTTIEEKIDRINGTYAIIERYTSDLTRSGYGLLRYSTNIASGANLISVGVQGSIEGGNRDITDTRNVFSGFSIYGAASNAYAQLMQEKDLNQYPLTQRITEDIYNTKISFDYLYDNDPSPQSIFDYTVSLTSGNNITASIQGDIKVRGGDVLQKFTNAMNYAGTLNLYNIVIPYYNSFYPYAIAGTAGNAASHPLNPIPLSSGIRSSLVDGTVSIFANFDNRDTISPIFDNFKYTINIVPPVQKVDLQPTVDVLGNFNNVGQYSMSDLGYVNRTSFNIKGTALTNESISPAMGLTQVKQSCVNIFKTYGYVGGNNSPTLDKEEAILSRFDDRLIEFDITWSYEGQGFVVAQFPYTTISSLTTNSTILPPA